MDIGTQEQISRLDTPASSYSTVTVSPDGQLLASGNAENTAIGLWDVQTRTLIGLLDEDTHDTGMKENGISALAFSPDGKTLASGNIVGYAVRLWDVVSQAQIALQPELEINELEE